MTLFHWQRHRYIIIGAIFLATLPLIGSGCALIPDQKTSQSGESVPVTETVRTAYIPLTANLPLFVAIENGFFAKHGLKVEAFEAASPNDIVAALVSDKIDFVGTLAYPILFAAAPEHQKAFVLFPSAEETETNYTASIIAKKGSPIQSPQDLRGKKIGVYGGLVQTTFLKAILTGMKIDLKDVKIIEINPRLQIQGLIAGEYDALSTTEPTANIALLQGHAQIVSANPRVSYIMSPFPSTASAINAKFMRDKPETANAIVRSLNDAIDFIKENPSEAKKSLLKYTPIPPEMADLVLADLKLFRYVKPGEEDRAQIQKLADYLFENKLIKERVPIDTLFFTPAK